ncbi:MAG: hypothetical protein MZV65_38235 [Chromatiales bacterium]|nr:hypothetical protein [Chromatiales bacterium]
MAASLADGAAMRPHGAPAYRGKRSTVGSVCPRPPPWSHPRRPVPVRAARMPDDPNSILDRLCIAFPARFDRKVPAAQNRPGRGTAGASRRPAGPGRPEPDRGAPFARKPRPAPAAAAAATDPPAGTAAPPPTGGYRKTAPVAARHPRRRRVQAGFPAVAC